MSAIPSRSILTGARFRPVSPQNAPGLRTLYNGNRFAAARPSYAATAASQSRSRNRDHFDARRRQFDNWFVNIYPNWPGYPYLLNPNLYNLGLYDWSDSDSFAPDNSAPNNYPYDQGGPSPDYPAPYPDYASAAAAPQPAVAPSTSSAPEQPLTVIFKTGRSPLQVQNYIMTASVFTDLDSGHYEQIPLDQINLAATQLINGAAGIDFQLPRASRD